MSNYCRSQNVLISFIIVLQACQWRNCEIFSSVAQLEHFTDLQYDLVENLKQHVLNREEKLKDLKMLLEENRNDESRKDFTKSNISTVAHVVAVLGSFARIRSKLRRTFTWFTDSKAKHQNMLTYLNEIKTSLPTKEDVDGAANAIIRLQETYKLDAESLITLSSQHSTPAMPLLLDEIYYLGRAAFSWNKIALTRQWMSLALRKLENETVDDKSGPRHHDADDIDYEIDIRDHLAFSHFKLGEYAKSLMYTKEILQRDSDNLKARTNLAILDEQIKAKGCKETVDSEDKEDYYMQHRYEALCRGEISLKRSEDKRRNRGYVCGYMKKDPLLRIRPVKYEVISTEPEILLIYEMANSYEMRVLRRLAFPYLERAIVSDNESNKLLTASYRISKSGWLYDDIHEVVRRINRRMEAVTGLSVQTAEDLQIANYGIGGHYEPHYDWSRNFEFSEMQKLGQGNRIATGLLYLNNVAKGGATVFTDAEVTIWPEQGTMAFWYNLDKNGSGKANTIHAACPVLFGNKWVANKWFHERGQEFRRRCSLDRFH